jgi:hypothetical protein
LYQAQAWAMVHYCCRLFLELTATCRGPNCVSQTVVFGNHGNVQGRDLLDISLVCPGDVDLRCPSTEEFAAGLQEAIDKSGDSLPFDRVSFVKEISFSPTTPSPSTTPPPLTPSPGLPSTFASPSVSAASSPSRPPPPTPPTSSLVADIPGNWERVMVLLGGEVNSISFSSDGTALAV